VQLLRVLAKAAPEDAIGATDAAAAQPGAAEDHGAGNAPAPAEARLPRAAAAPPGAIGSRQDVIDALGRVCTWIETNEPSHPAPLLIRRAQRLMSKSFIEIIQDLTPEAEAEVRRLAGVTGD
jgi:type VI secretion system protein ImpA